MLSFLLASCKDAEDLMDLKALKEAIVQQTVAFIHPVTL